MERVSSDVRVILDTRGISYICRLEINYDTAHVFRLEKQIE